MSVILHNIEADLKYYEKNIPKRMKRLRDIGAGIILNPKPCTIRSYCQELAELQWHMSNWADVIEEWGDVIKENGQANETARL